MKIKITRPDGTIIEATGTPEECERVVGKPVDIVSPMPMNVMEWGRPGTNGGVRCDMVDGPCACGAWHSPRSLTVGGVS